MIRIAVVNGRPADACSVFDRGLQFGDGLFETMFCVDGRIQDAEGHWERLERGLSQLEIACPDLRANVAAIVGDAGQGRAVAKLVVTRGNSERGYRSPAVSSSSWILTVADPPLMPPGSYELGVDVKLCKTRLAVEDPRLAGLKHLNRLPQVMARREWEDEYHEGLLSDPNGNWVEGCSSNLFLVDEAGLLTPDHTTCGVRGVMRQSVMAHAKARGIPCRVGQVSRDSLARAREVFLTNAVLGIVPVRAIEGRPYGPGPMTRKLMLELPRGVQS